MSGSRIPVRNDAGEVVGFVARYYDMLATWQAWLRDGRPIDSNRWRSDGPEFVARENENVVALFDTLAQAAHAVRLVALDEAAGT